VQHGGPIWCHLLGKHGSHPHQSCGDLLWLLHDYLTRPGGCSFSTVAKRDAAAPVATTVSDLAMETHPPRPYDLIQEIERVISMMEDTLEICE
jgi:hypothetical protein